MIPSFPFSSSSQEKDAPFPFAALFYTAAVKTTSEYFRLELQLVGPTSALSYHSITPMKPGFIISIGFHRRQHVARHGVGQGMEQSWGGGGDVAQKHDSEAIFL